MSLSAVELKTLQDRAQSAIMGALLPTPTHTVEQGELALSIIAEVRYTERDAKEDEPDGP
jgi:hypothetical protein